MDGGQEITEAETSAVADHLDNVALRLIEADFDGYADAILLPYVVVTRRDRYIRASREDLRYSYEMWQRTIAAHGIGRMAHRIHRIGRLGDAAYIVDYRTKLLRGADEVLPHFDNIAFLRRGTDGRLRHEQLVSGVSNAGHSLFLKVDVQCSDPVVAGRKTP